MASVLTTLNRWKKYAGITDTKNDAFYQTLIDQACDAIERHCGRTFKSTTYRSWLDGDGEQWLLLPNWPVLNIYGVAFNTEDIAEVKFTGGAHATLAVSQDYVTLYSVDTSGTATETAIAIADNKTAAALKTSIEAVTGWTCAIRAGQTGCLTALLQPFDSIDALSPEYAELYGAYDFAESKLADRSDRCLVADTCLPKGYRNIFVWYKAGYTEPADGGSDGTMPPMLMNIANALTSDLWTRTQSNTDFKSESIGDYSYTRADDSMVDKMAAKYADALSVFRRLVF